MSAGRLSVGSVLSILNPDCVFAAEFPAMSWQVPVADRLAPSVEIVWLTEALTGPDRPSVQDQSTVTSLLFHPLIFGDGMLLTNEIIGFVLSSLMVKGVAFVISPALLVQEPLKTVPAVSAVWNWLPVQVTGLLAESVPEV